MSTERRYIGAQPSGIEIRKAHGKPTRLAGYAAVFYRANDPGTEFELFDNHVERILPGAFDKVQGDDVRALYNHDPNHLLGRTQANTLRLSVDDVGLRYEVDLPDTQTGRDIATSAERGDLTGSSFAFMVRDGGFRWRDEGKISVRELRDLELMDVSPVTYPAYQSTSVAARSEDIEAIKAERDRVKREKEAEEVRSRAEQICKENRLTRNA